MPYRPRFVDVHGVKTCYVEAGEGEPLVCIHGGGPGASGEHGFRNNIPALARRFRVIAPDMIGYGYTDKPPIQYWEQRLVEHVSNFIDALCLLEHSGHQCQNDEVDRFNEIALKFFS